MKRAWFQDPERRRTVLRVVGLCVGLLFFAAAVHFAMRERMEFAKAMEALRDPPPVAVFAVLASVAVGAVLTALLFHILMRRFGKVPFWEMQALIAASAFANYLPLKPGFVGRVAYHRLRHGIRAAHTLRTILEAIALSGTVASLFLLSLLSLRTLKAHGIDMMGHTIEGEWALLVPSVLAVGAFWPRLRPLAQALLVRQVELALWTLRYWAVFQLVGAPIELETAIVLGSVSVIATLLPVVSNGLGIREWVIGILAPMISHEPVSTSQAIIAVLVHRAAEIAVMSPFGIASIVVLVRHNRRLALSRDVSGSHVESETRRESEARRESETRREDPAS
jgi:uncharacterized membrane protein YbhN (UPF0104 family)